MTRFDGKILLLKSARYCCPLQSSDDDKRALLDAMFWLCDTMRDDVKERCHPSCIPHNVATVDILQDYVEKSFKGQPTSAYEDEEFERQCHKFLNGVPDAPERDQ